MKVSLLQFPGILLLCCGLTACSESAWYRPDGSRANIVADRYFCERDFRQSHYFGRGIVFAMNAGEFFGRCMNAKGWERRKKSEADSMTAERATRLQNAASAHHSCTAQFRASPRYAIILKYLPDPETGHFSFMQMSSNTRPASAETQALIDYFSATGTCRQDFIDTIRPYISEDQMDVVELGRNQSEINAAQLTRGEITFGEWASRENQETAADYIKLQKK